MANIQWYIDPEATGAGDGTSWTDAYNSQSAFEAAEQVDLSAAGNSYYVNCRSLGGTSDSVFVSYNGWTTDASNFVYILSVDWTTGKPSTSCYHMTNATTCIENFEDFVYCEKIQMYGTPGYYYRGATATNHNYMYECYIESQGNAIQITDSDCVMDIRNTVITGGNIGSTYGIQFAGATLNLYNCTVAGELLGVTPLSQYRWCIRISAGSGTINATNCITDNSRDGNYDAGAGTIVTNYCASTDATAVTYGGGNNRGSQTFTYNDRTNRDYQITQDDAGAKGYGNDLSGSFTIDIIGDTRTTPWDIGAYKYLLTAVVPQIQFLRNMGVVG